MSGGEKQDQTMDKKIQRKTSLSNKNAYASSDGKKDGRNGRSGRGNYSSQSSRQDPIRPRGNRQAVQLGQDKRPQPRCGASLYQGEKMRDSLSAEPGSVFNVGSKKNNLNHLLNFNYGPRDVESNYRDEHYRGRGKGRRAVKFNKEQFLQACCQFVVKDEVDYSVQVAQPDSLVEWDSVEQVRVSGPEVPSCPICLYPPTAAKMTKCGHIYCWACILHYLSLGEKSWRKCPICYEAVHKKDLKSVVAVEKTAVAVGESITFKLMKRERNSPHVMPIEQWMPRSQPHSITDNVDLCYSKLLVAPRDFVQNLIDKERVALETQHAEAGVDTLDGSFVQAALDSLKEWELSLNASSDLTNTTSSPEEIVNPGLPGVEVSELKGPINGVIEYASAFSDEEVDEPDHDRDDPLGDLVSSADAKLNDNASATSVLACSSDDQMSSSPEIEEYHSHDSDTKSPNYYVADTHTEDKGKNSHRNRPLSHFYFYQASDGQHIYLHSINSRCLSAEYGNLEDAPHTITGTVVELEHMSMTEDLRNRRRYMAHLPLTCELQIAEVVLTSPVISDKTIATYSDEIAKRRHFRQKKEKCETRKLKKLQEEADKRLFGKYPHMRYDVSSSNHVPECNSVIVPSAAPEHSSSPKEETQVISPLVENTNAVEEELNQATFSFAQMLRHGKVKQTEAWPKRPSESESQSSEKCGSEESDNDDKVPIPVYQNSFGDAIQKALDSYDKNPGKPAGVKEVASFGGKKKKKKKLLFMTSMARGSNDH